jgi:SPP1 gp7 family putative phage head morphogenesis protein
MNMANKMIKSKWFNHYATTAAYRMITMTRKDTGKSWRQAARNSTHGRKVFELLRNETDNDKTFQELLSRNVHYIKSAPIDMAERMVTHISEAQIAGRRPEQIASELKELFPHMTKGKAQLIARTESAKASSELVQSRAERLGFNWYIWYSVQDQRVRSSHKHMQGVLVNYNDPPSPEALADEKSYGHYNAGEIFNCRCFASVVFDINEISFPHKVYHAGSIQMMTKAKFKEIM